MRRKATVKGSFYPGESSLIEGFIKENMPQEFQPQETKGIMLPHAGYIYSGRVAVETVAKTKPKEILVIMGPNHTGRGASFSVYPEGVWETPLGDIEIAKELAQKITENNLLQLDTQAHFYEHSIEVELPILKYFFGDFKIVPIVCSLANISVYKEIAKIIYQALREEEVLEKSLIVASSDMTHYQPQKIACQNDKFVIEAILNLDTAEFLKRVEEKDVSMCGVAPVGIMLEILQLWGAKNSSLVRYTTSAERNRDYSSVVGYAGIIFN